MRFPVASPLAVTLGLLAIACREPGPGSAGPYVLSDEHASPVRLPDELTEVSGLTATPDGRLFAHGDERARIFQIDPASGEVLKRFQLGDPPEQGDFEGIAHDGARFYLMTSSGKVLVFAEGGPDQAVDFDTLEPELGRACELEGLAFDPAERTLMMPCKISRGSAARSFVVLEIDPAAPTRPARPAFEIPFDDMRQVGASGRFRASGIEFHPVSGNLFVVAGPEQALIELTRDGRFVSVARLPRSLHQQPEGIAFDRDGGLLIADEGAGGRARLTRYAPARQIPEGG